jgi:hypothetical protein
MKRFVPLAAAVLIGLVACQDLPPTPTPAPETPPATPETPPAAPETPPAAPETQPATPETPPANQDGDTAQGEFIRRSESLALTWDKKYLATTVSNCKVFNSLTVFDLEKIRGPYVFDIDIDDDGSKDLLEVHFCGPVYQKSDLAKKSLVYIRDTVTAVEDEKRKYRLTSGELSFTSSEISYKDDKISGVKLIPKLSSDESLGALCKQKPWIVTMNIMCDDSKTFLSYKDFSVNKDSDKCTLDITATHKAGCGYAQASGFVQYLNSQPWLIALITIGGGIAACFFGGILFDYIVIAVPAFFAFLFVAVVLSSMGLFAVLEEGTAATGKNIIQVIFGTVLALAAGIGAGYFVYRTKQIAMGIFGAIGGFFFGFLFYSMVFAMFIKSSTILLWIILIVCTAVGGWAMFKYQEEAELHLTVFIGAYLIIRGVGFFAGGFPNEA